MVESRRLGKTGIEMAPIALGCAQMAATGMTSRVYPTRKPDAVIQAALSGGVNWFDMVVGHGRGESERALATGLRAAGVRLGRVLIATKWPPVGRGPAGIARTVGVRIGALRGCPIDLYQIHQPWGLSSVESETRETAHMLRAAKIRSIGVSDFSARPMSRAAAALRVEGVEPSAHQVQINLLNRNTGHRPQAGCQADRVLPAARRHPHRTLPRRSSSPAQGALVAQGPCSAGPGTWTVGGRWRARWAGSRTRTVSPALRWR